MKLQKKKKKKEINRKDARDIGMHVGSFQYGLQRDVDQVT